MSRLRRTAVVLALAAGASAVLAPAAEAHVVADNGWSYVSSNNCTNNRAEVSHGNLNGVYFKADTRSDYAVYGVDCVGDWFRSAGQIRVAFGTHKWNGSAWAYCNGSGWRYNSGTTDKAVVAQDNSKGPCGTGYYRTIAMGHVLNGSTWYGGQWVTTGHYATGY